MFKKLLKWLWPDKQRLEAAEGPDSYAIQPASLASRVHTPPPSPSVLALNIPPLPDPPGEPALRDLLILREEQFTPGLHDRREFLNKWTEKIKGSPYWGSVSPVVRVQAQIEYVLRYFNS